MVREPKKRLRATLSGFLALLFLSACTIADIVGDMFGSADSILP